MLRQDVQARGFKVEKEKLRIFAARLLPEERSALAMCDPREAAAHATSGGFSS